MAQRKKRERFLPTPEEWPALRAHYLSLVRIGYSAEEASKAMTDSWFRKRAAAGNKPEDRAMPSGELGHLTSYQTEGGE